MSDVVLTSGVHVTLSAPNPRVVMAPPSTTVTVVPVRGPAGPTGSTYDYHQIASASQWTITHNLNHWPVPVVFLDDAPTTPVTTDVTYLSANAFILTFPTPVTGWVHIN